MNKRNSIQRQLILDALKTLKHPTAARVHESIKVNYPNISLGTVYRNLNIMAEEKRVNKLSFPDEPDRFDMYTHRHYHITCSKCHEVFDTEKVQKGLLENLEKELETSTGFTISGHNLYFSGICPSCKRENK